MNEIMITNDNLIPKETENQIIKIEEQIAELKKAQEEMKSKLIQEMAIRNIKKIETEKITITYIEPTTRETFDTKSFRADHSDLYDEDAKLSDVKAAIRIGVKK